MNPGLAATGSAAPPYLAPARAPRRRRRPQVHRGPVCHHRGLRGAGHAAASLPLPACGPAGGEFVTGERRREGGGLGGEGEGGDGSMLCTAATMAGLQRQLSRAARVLLPVLGSQGAAVEPWLFPIRLLHLPPWTRWVWPLEPPSTRPTASSARSSGVWRLRRVPRPSRRLRWRAEGGRGSRAADVEAAHCHCPAWRSIPH